MENELIWLRISIFSAKEYWGQILGQVQSFIDHWKPRQCISLFNTEFNYISGENIRVSILCRDDFKQLIAQDFDIFFTDFLIRSNFHVRQQSLPINGIFLPHPPNSVRYGLYDVIGNDPNNRQIDTVISSAMIQALGPERVDEESILTFAFYLNVGILKALKNSDLTPIYNRDLPDNGIKGEIDITIIRDKYEYSKEMLSEIFQEIMSGLDIATWLDEWISVCEVEIQKHHDTLNNQEKYSTQISFRLINQINKHFGLSENMKLMLDFFMTQTLADTSL